MSRRLRYGPLSQLGGPDSKQWVLHVNWHRVYLDWADLVAGPMSKTFCEEVNFATDRWPEPMTRDEWNRTLQVLFDELFMAAFGLPDARPSPLRNPLQALIDEMDEMRETLFGRELDDDDDGGDR